MDRRFLFGVVVGVAGVYVFHRYVRPMPSKASGQDMNGVLAAWAVEVGIIGIRDLTSSKRLPLPSEILATFIVFGGLSALAGLPNGRQPATAVAWGLVVATALSSKVDFLKPVGDFLAPGGTNAQAADILQNSTAPSPTGGSGAGDTGNITAGLRPA